MNAITTVHRAPLPAADDRRWNSSSRRGHRTLRLLLRTLGAAVGLIALVAASGATYEAISGVGDAAAYPPTGRLVDIGGYRLHLDCRGAGTPTVVMDAGLGGSSLEWTLVQSDVSSTTQVCTFDRAGMGWSDVGPLPRTPKQIADELHTLLANAGIAGPYLLVGHSLAGKNIRMFASVHPDEVAGMVLVDARSEVVDNLTTKAEADAFHAALGLQGVLYSVARRLGVARAFGAGLVGEPLVPPAIAAEMAILQTQPTAIDDTINEGLERSADDTALATSSLGSMPLVVIASAASMADIPNWSAAQSKLAALSTQGRLVVAEHSGHTVQLEQPGIVIDGIRQVLAEVRQRNNH